VTTPLLRTAAQRVGLGCKSGRCIDRIVVVECGGGVRGARCTGAHHFRFAT